MQVVGFDSETVPFSPGSMAPHPVVFSFSDSKTTDLAHWSRGRDKVLSLLWENRPLAIANAAYDMACICSIWPDVIPHVFAAYDKGIVHDILIRQKLIDLANGSYQPFYSLASTVKRMFDVELDKEGSPRTDYKKYLNEPDLDKWEQAHIDYAKDDAVWHRRVWEYQQEELAKRGALDVLQDQIRQSQGAWFLHLASVWGITTDAKGIQALEQHAKAERSRIEPLLLQQNLISKAKKKGEIYLKKNTKIVQQYLVANNGGYAGLKLTKKGLELKREGLEYQLPKYVATDAEACTQSNDPLLNDYSHYAQLGTLLDGFVKAVSKGVDKPIHTKFDSLRETGRTSSSNPNIQNIARAKGARECFVPRPGCVFISCDYDKAELHTLAQICIHHFGWSKLADALNSGFDPHTGVGAELAGITYEKALEELEAGNKEVAEWRQRAKPANFGFPGGMQPATFVLYAKAQNIHLTQDMAETIFEGWARAWPEVSGEYLPKLKRECRPNGGRTTVVLPYTGLIRHDVRFTQAANFGFQGLAAAGAKAAGYEIARHCYNERKSPLFGARIVNFIHDEFLVEVKENQANDAAWKLREIMVEEFNAFTPDVPVRATPCLMDRWSKGAKPLVDENGKLKVWRYEG